MRPSALLVLLVPTTAAAQEATGPLEVGADTSDWQLSVAAGVSTIDTGMPGMLVMGASARSIDPAGTTERSFEPTGLFSLRFRLSERVVWSVPTASFAYLGGTAGAREWIPWGGLTSWGLGYSSIEGLIGQGEVGAGIGVRQWLEADTTFNVTTGATSGFLYRDFPACTDPAVCGGWNGLTTWVVSASAGISHRLGDRLTVNLGVVGARAIANDAMDTNRISIGSVQDIGLRRLPLVEAQLTRNWSLDGYAAASYSPSSDRFEQHYLVGFTRRWLPDAPARQLAAQR